MNNLTKIIQLSVIFVGLIIGIHQSITVGFQESYWIFMITFVLYLVYAYQKGKNKS